MVSLSSAIWSTLEGMSTQGYTTTKYLHLILEAQTQASMKEERLIDLLSPLEKVTLANEFSSLGATYFTLYLTLLSGYLVVAFLAGRKLTKSQVTTVNWVFILSAIFFTLSTLGNFIFSIGYYMAAPWRESILQGFYLMGALDIVMALAMVAGIFASLKFMKNIRESKLE